MTLVLGIVVGHRMGIQRDVKWASEDGWKATDYMEYVGWRVGLREHPPFAYVVSLIKRTVLPASSFVSIEDDGDSTSAEGESVE